MSVALQPAGRRDRPLLAALLDDYAGEFQPGRFCRPYPRLDSYWRDPRRFAYLFHDGFVVVGFALLNPFAWLRPAPDFTIAEFSILPSARRRGFGRDAARALWHRHPGRWQVAVAPRSRRASAFWAATIAGPGITGHRCLLRGGRPVHQFRARA